MMCITQNAIGLLDANTERQVALAELVIQSIEIN